MYLLLRNNKQSGPFSLEELKSMGLKAYDLVWLEGKSAAWRYPSEIDELSAFAPAVEEQPFDRFYKKPIATPTADTAVLSVASGPAPERAIVAMPDIVSAPAVVPTPTIVSTPAEPAPAPSAPIYTGEPSAVPGKRIIYVTMPAGKSIPMREIPREQTAVRETPKEPVRPPAASVTVPATTDPAHTPYASGPGYNPAYATSRIEDYSSQLPSLEEQLEAVSPRSKSRRRESERRVFADGRQKEERSARVVRLLLIGGSVLALLAAGIFIGLSLNKNSIGNEQEKIASKGPDQPTAHPPAQQLSVPATAPAQMTVAAEKPKDSTLTMAGHVESSVPPVTKPPHPVTSKERPAASKKGVMPPPVVKDSTDGMNSPHREAVHRTDAIETKAESKAVDKDAARISISSQVSVGANGYTVGTFGGINDLQLTVTNRSVYPLDLVVVEVQYIQANKKVYKTENLYFRNIGAGSALMQEAPKSSRGIKVQYKITTISSKDLGLSYSGI
jgi:hypothetical protein